MGEAGFAAAAARLAGVAGAMLGWAPETFWRATPEELGTVLRALAGPQAEGLGRDDLKRLMEADGDG